MIRDQIRPTTPESDSMYVFFLFLKIICVLYTPPGCPVGLRSDSASPVDIHRTLVICTGLCWMSGDCLVIVR